MGFTYVGYENIAGFCRNHRFILAQIFPFSLYDKDGKLAFKVMGVNRENYTSSKVEIDNSEIR